MESSVTRPAVDVATDRPKPGLALLLAVLAIPGSTVAWDLPAGGLYIGLPLGIAAIVLGVRARREQRSGHGARRDHHRRPLHRPDGDLDARIGCELGQQAAQRGLSRRRLKFGRRRFSCAAHNHPPRGSLAAPTRDKQE